MNKLLDGSISLSNLNQNLMNDLHISNATIIYREFPMALCCSDIDHHLSGPNAHA